MYTLKPQEVLFQQNAILWQDKSGSVPDRSASPEAYRTKNGVRSNHSDTHLVPYTTQIKQYVKEEIHRIAKREGLSDSAVGSAFLEKMVQHDANMHYGALLEPVIRSIIRSEFLAFENRFLALIARVAYEVSQILFFVVNILSVILKDDEKSLRDVEIASEKSARVNITRRTPQIAEVIGKLKQSMEVAN